MGHQFQIHGLGTAVPPHTMSQREATVLGHEVICRSPKQERLLSVLYRMAGVKKRHTVLPHRIALQWLPENARVGAAVGVEDNTNFGPTTRERMQFFADCAPPLALEAGRRALEAADLAGARVTHLVMVSCTGFESPGIDTALLEGLRLRPTTQRIQVGFMGCHGAINGLRTAHALAAMDPSACILLCAVELCSLHYQFRWDEDRMVANALFADGAAAAIGSGRGGRDEDAWRVIATGSCLVPDSEDAMTWRIGDHGFEMTLSARVPDLIGQHLRPWLSVWLEEQGLSLESVGSWAVHPGGPRILTAVTQSLGLPESATEVSREVLAQFGNMSSPTILFILDRLRQAKAPRPCVALGFGPGMFAEAALLE